MFNLYRKTWAAVGFILCLFSVVYAYSGGSGTSPDPYQIGTVSDWNDLMNTSSDWDKYFIMTADIDLQGVPLTPVGSAAINFTGVFDGDGYIIYNAIINGSTYVGLFGRVYTAGRISNLGVEDINVTGTSSYVGGLAGRNYGIITECYVTGRVTGSGTYVGSIAGGNNGSIIDCYSTSDVNGSGNVGGLVGSNGSSVSDVNTSYSTGLVTGTGTYVGGLVGYNYGDIIDSYATGAVAGSSSVGGLTGYISGGSVSTCYSIGEVNGTSDVGGLIGYRSAGNVDVNSFWDINTSDCDVSAGGTGKTTAQMQDPNTFLNALWDFTTPIWRICNGTNYPKLDWQDSLTGDFVCPDGVNFEDFAYFAQRWLRADCAVTNDCDGTDIYTDGTVNLLDFALFAENWLQGL